MIHYHGLPMTPTAEMLHAFGGRHAMVSFEYPDQIDLAAEICQSIVLDCGAYSAWKQGKAHDFSGYAAWCGHWLKHPAVDWCIIPDVIDGDEAQNQQLVEAWPHDRARSVPVWHYHETLTRLLWLCSEFPRVALGSSGAYADPGSPSWWARTADAMRWICDEEGRPMTKLMLDPVIFSHLPLSSADSCNVARNIGIDAKWNGPYAPRSRWMRALILMDRIERHASAARWSPSTAGVQHNLELIG